MEQAGQALVEFALVLPLLLFCAFAIVQLSELGVARLALAHAAAEGARIGALTNDDELVRDTVAAASAPLDAARIGIEIAPSADEPPRDGDPRGALLRVRLRYPLPLRIGGLPALVVEGAAARRIEWTP